MRLQMKPRSCKRCLSFGVDYCRAMAWLVAFECNSELDFRRGIFDQLLSSSTCMLLRHSSRYSNSCYTNMATAKSRTHRNRKQLRFITPRENSSQHDVDIWTSQCLLHAVLVRSVCNINPRADKLYALCSIFQFICGLF